MIAPIFEAVVTYLTDAGIPFAQVDGETSVRVGVHSGPATWVCQIEAHDPDGLMIAYSLVPVIAPEARRAEVMEFVTRANDRMHLGNFELDLDTGNVRYKTAVDVVDGRLEERMFSRLFQANIAAVDAYLPGLVEVVEGNLSARDAVEAIEAG